MSATADHGTTRKKRVRDKAINVRALTAFIVTWAFAVAIVTGIVLYVVPQGRVAYWTDWHLISLAKDVWSNIHIVFGAIFIVSGVLHLYRTQRRAPACQARGRNCLRGDSSGGGRSHCRRAAGELAVRA